VESDAILRVKATVSSGDPALDVIKSMMQPCGWAWHLRNGQLGIWAPSDPLTLTDATVVLDRTVKTRTDEDADYDPPKHGFRFTQPVDKWTFDYNRAPHLGTTAKMEKLSPDRSMAYRPGTVNQTIIAHAMRQPLGVVERLSTMSKWWARRHFPVPGYPVSIIEAEDLWPGTIVRLTDPGLTDPRGSYGVTNRIAIVTSVRVTLGVKTGTAAVDLLVLDDGGTAPRHHAPVAMARGWDSATSRLYLYANGFGIEGFTNDAGQWVEPSYAGIAQFGGNAILEVWQFDGSTLTQTFSGTVSGSGADYVTLTATSGTYWRDMDSIVVLRSTTIANAAWVDTLFSPICTDAGTWTDVATPTNGYNWEP
jgi:hypothetical protein